MIHHCVRVLCSASLALSGGVTSGYGEGSILWTILKPAAVPPGNFQWVDCFTLSSGAHSMCGRFTLRTPPSVVQTLFSTAAPPAVTPRYNIAPTQRAPVVRRAADTNQAANEIALARWGLTPSWAKDLKSAARMINARSETASSKPAFRAAFKRRRCLVPADGYFEWKKQGKEKTPIYFTRDDGSLLALAGLWESWRDPEDEAAEPVESFTILTTAANSLATEVHDRMPVIIDRSDFDLWLDPGAAPDDQLQELFRPYDSGALRATVVSSHVNKVANDDPQCIEPGDSQGELF